jgi:Chaperone of endosialidase
MKTTIPRNPNLSLLLIPLVLAYFGLSPTVQAGTSLGAGNTADGAGALNSLTAGIHNTAEGYQALFSDSLGSYNTATGSQALKNDAGERNTADGFQALVGNKSGFGNTAVGWRALFSNTNGGANTAIGLDALYHMTSGSRNTALGTDAGFDHTSGDLNIYIASNEGPNVESNTIRIGNSSNQTAAYIAGIFGATSTGSPVGVDSLGHLGVLATSSARFKDEIKPMDKTSEAILALKPVTFRYKKELDRKGIPQFGLVAEDVEKVNPDLVTRDRDGKLYTVRYEAVNAMLLNEFLKEHRTVQKQQKEIDVLKAELKEQKALIQKVSDKVELSKPAPRTVLNKP